MGRRGRSQGVPRVAAPSWDGGVRVPVPFQVEVPACEVPSSWEVGEVPARGVRNWEEAAAGLLGAWGEGREQVIYHVRKLVLQEFAQTCSFPDIHYYRDSSLYTITVHSKKCSCLLEGSHMNSELVDHWMHTRYHNLELNRMFCLK